MYQLVLKLLIFGSRRTSRSKWDQVQNLPKLMWCCSAGKRESYRILHINDCHQVQARCVEIPNSNGGVSHENPRSKWEMFHCNVWLLEVNDLGIQLSSGDKIPLSLHWILVGFCWDPSIGLWTNPQYMKDSPQTNHQTTEVCFTLLSYWLLWLFRDVHGCSWMFSMDLNLSNVV